MSKRELSRIFLLGWLVCAMAGMAFGQGVYEAWVARYNGPGNSGDIARALAVDDSGYVYVTGGSVGSGSIQDYATIKYKPNGDTAWVRTYNGPANHDDGAYAIAIDDSGFVYVTGQSLGVGTAYDYATIKYRPNGDTAWLRRYNRLGNSSDAASAIVVDDTGNVYVTGRSNGGFSFDYATIKYAPNGDTLWVRFYDGPGNWDDEATALALDALGNVYVTGESGPYPDYVTIKYAPSGDTLWVRRYNAPENSDDWASALAIDSNGNVYVTGYSYGGGSSYDYATIKYSPDGDSLWVRRYDGAGKDDWPYAMALDDSGNVYVTGFTAGSGFVSDYATIKYSLCSAIPGDVNSTGDISLGDILHVVNYIFDKDKLPCLGIDPSNCWTPGPFCRGDVNQTTTITIGDIVHLVNYIFDKDRLPCLGSNPGNCWTPETSGACCLAVP